MTRPFYLIFIVVSRRKIDLISIFVPVTTEISSVFAVISVVKYTP
mgnify:CR=1 FL=1